MSSEPIRPTSHVGVIMDVRLREKLERKARENGRNLSEQIRWELERVVAK